MGHLAGRSAIRVSGGGWQGGGLITVLCRKRETLLSSILLPGMPDNFAMPAHRAVCFC